MTDNISESERFAKYLDIFREDNTNLCAIREIGRYYQDKVKDYDNMKKYYNIGIELGERSCMHQLGWHYQFTEIDYELMEKYYLMANLLESYGNLGWHYQYTVKEYDNMKKYYDRLLSDYENLESNAEKPFRGFMFHLAEYYQYTEVNVELMESYYLKAINLGHSPSMECLGSYYNRDGTREIAIKYWQMGAENKDTDCMLHLARHYGYIDKDFTKMEKYCLMANEHGEPFGLVELSHYYYDSNKELMLKYLLEAVEKKSSDAIEYLGDYYSAEDDYDLMKKYYIMGADMGDPPCMHKLGDHFRYVEKDYELMKKYYIMGANMGDSYCMYKLGDHFRHVEEDYELMKKYYFMGLNEDIDKDVIYSLKEYYDYEYYDNNNNKIPLVDKLTFYFKYVKKCPDNININSFHIDKSILELLIETDLTQIGISDTHILSVMKKLLTDKIDLIDLHFNYQPGSDGCAKAKQDFWDKVSSTAVTN